MKIEFLFFNGLFVYFKLNGEIYYIPAAKDSDGYSLWGFAQKASEKVVEKIKARIIPAQRNDVEESSFGTEEEAISFLNKIIEKGFFVGPDENLLFGQMLLLLDNEGNLKSGGKPPISGADGWEMKTKLKALK